VRGGESVLKIMALVVHIALQVVLIPLFLFWMESVFGPVPATLLILGYILTMPRTLNTRMKKGKESVEK